MPRFKSTDRDLALDQNRQRLLDAAADEFSHKGYLGANINNISTAAGYAKGTIYNYFPSKSALILALIDWVAAMHLDFMKERVLQEKDPSLRLVTFFKAGFDFVRQHYSEARVMFNVVYGPNEEQKLYIFTAYQPIFDLVAKEIIAFGVQQGVFQSVDPGKTATLLMTIYLGTASQTNEQAESWLDPDQVAALALHGLVRSE